MRFAERLKWSFAALFLLCGAPLVLGLELGPGAEHTLAGMATLFLGAFALGLAWDAWSTGHIDIQNYNYNRTDHPIRFRATIVLILLAGCGTVVAGLWFLFLK